MFSEDKVGFGPSQAPHSQFSSQAQQPQLPLVQFLLSQGRCDVNLKNNRNQSPLHLAVIQGHVGMVQLLVSQGSDVNAEDEDGDTAMHIALERQQLMALAMEKRDGEMGASLLSKVSWEQNSSTDRQENAPWYIISRLWGLGGEGR